MKKQASQQKGVCSMRVGKGPVRHIGSDIPSSIASLFLLAKD